MPRQSRLIRPHGPDRPTRTPRPVLPHPPHRRQLWDLLEELLAHDQGLRRRGEAAAPLSPAVARLCRARRAARVEDKHADATVLLPAHRCLRCGRVWVAARVIPPAIPRRCPSCNSERWFYPESYSRAYQERRRARRREQEERDLAWEAAGAEEQAGELHRLLLRRVAYRAEKAAAGSRKKGRRGPALGCACVGGHPLQEGREHPSCSREGCPCAGLDRQ